MAPEYILGHTDPEIERLQLLAGVIGGVTRRLILECGIQPGMRVLDRGCGVGDVSMLLAEAVGDTGSVLAFDREPRAVETAKARADSAGYRQIEFVVTSDDALPQRPPFDAALGRYVLVHQSDPVAMVRRAATVVRPGGVIEPTQHLYVAMQHGLLTKNEFVKRSMQSLKLLKRQEATVKYALNERGYTVSGLFPAPSNPSMDRRFVGPDR